jgi:hypothetical protein
MRLDGKDRREHGRRDADSAGGVKAKSPARRAASLGRFASEAKGPLEREAQA